MTADPDRPTDLARLLRRVAPDLERLARAARDLADAPGRPTPDGGPVPAARLEQIAEWRRAYDALHAAGVRPLEPDGAVLEVVAGGRRAIVERGDDGDGPRALRERAEGARSGPLSGRYPWFRVI